MARFAEKCARSLKEVYVVDPDESYILSVVNNISSYAQTVMSYADTKRLEDTRLSSSATQLVDCVYSPCMPSPSLCKEFYFYIREK